MRPSTCALRSIPLADRKLTIHSTLVRASGSVGDCVPLILASYQRPPCSPPVREWFGAISPKRPFSPFKPVAPRTLLLDGPDWALVIKQFGKRFGWAPWVTTAPHPRPWSRADSAPPPVLALCPQTDLLSVAILPQLVPLPRACHASPITRCYQMGCQHLSESILASVPLRPGLYYPFIAAINQAGSQHLPPGPLPSYNSPAIYSPCDWASTNPCPVTHP